MTEPENSDGLHVITIGGQDIKVRKLTELQLMLMVREAKVSMKPGVDQDRVLTAAERLLDMTLSVIPDPGDREYVEQLAMAGQLQTAELLTLIQNTNEAPVPTKPAVRRGRPPKKAV